MDLASILVRNALADIRSYGCDFRVHSFHQSALFFVWIVVGDWWDLLASAAAPYDAILVLLFAYLPRGGTICFTPQSRKQWNTGARAERQCRLALTKRLAPAAFLRQLSPWCACGGSARPTTTPRMAHQFVLGVALLLTPSRCCFVALR